VGTISGGVRGILHLSVTTILLITPQIYFQLLTIGGGTPISVSTTLSLYVVIVCGGVGLKRLNRHIQ